jgi:hypothetical protein
MRPRLVMQQSITFPAPRFSYGAANFEAVGSGAYHDQ